MLTLGASLGFLAGLAFYFIASRLREAYRDDCASCGVAYAARRTAGAIFFFIALPTGSASAGYGIARIMHHLYN
jgi:hypothetical protein